MGLVPGAAGRQRCVSAHAGVPRGATRPAAAATHLARRLGAGDRRQALDRMKAAEQRVHRLGVLRRVLQPQQNFLALELPALHFDGIFANASLFHVPSRELPWVLGELHATLKDRGVLFASNPRGNNEEGFNGGRYGVWHDLEMWRRYVTGAGFVEITHYYRPAGLPREQQPWLATVWRKAPVR